jgi:DNA-binding winged helix-turn-helix (wHTH) protein/TolB-like protein/tetratricopeptide (TPR) repeat protein
MPLSDERIAFGEFVLEPAQQRVLRRDGTTLQLTPRLFSALSLLIEHRGELLEKEWLMRALWPGMVVEENNLSQVVSGLRRALGERGRESRFIETVPRRGFRFIAPVTFPAGDAPVATPSSAAPAVTPQGPTALDEDAAPAGSSVAAAGPRRRLLQGAFAAFATAGLVAIGMRIRRGPAAAPAAAPTLAVLPFRLLVPNEGDRLLEVGMADSLITRLSAVPGLVVRSTGAVRRYTDREQDPLRAAADLDVRWIVDGSVQRVGDQLRVTSRLLQASDGRALWAGSFDERFTSVFDVQDRISNRVVQVLAPELRLRASAIAPVADVGGTRSPEAYQLYLAAMRRAESGRGDSLREAVELYRQALAIDPAYADAWVGLAWAHRRGVWNADALPGEAFDRSSEALKRAIALVPGFVPARAAIGTTKYFHDFDWPGAERELLGVLEINPNLSAARWDLALLMLTQDRIEAGFEQLRMARELEPTSPVLNAIEASFLIDSGRLAAARLRLSRAFDFAPNLWLSHVALGLLRFAERKPDDGIIAMRRAVELTDETTRPRAVLAFHLAKVGRQDETRAILQGMLARSRTRFVPPTSLALVHAALGERTAVLDQLERGLAMRDTRMIYLKDDPGWADVRSEPRFKSLMMKLGLDHFGPGLTPI